MTCPRCGSALPDGSIVCGGCGRPVSGRTPTAGPVVAAPAPPPSEQRPAVPPPRPAQPPRDEQPRFVLQFSTGESIVVHGAGIIGRSPSAEPGEYVDHLIPIVDVAKSVSKSHLAFGSDRGTFWVTDRFSTNGTVVRSVEGAERRCEPGKRYHLERGSRVAIGDQFFIVS